MPSTANLSIIIPFYQKEAGILSRAIRSVLSQTSTIAKKIIVIDDESPISAESELAECIAENPSLFLVIRQPNKGPAGARNKGLDHVPEGTDFVAFLDSDDEWSQGHLDSAITALNSGYDFYFADHYQLNQTVSGFNRAKRINPDDCPLLPGQTHLHIYPGDMFSQVLSGNIIGTSTVVYRWDTLKNIRFREEFINAGEDYLFWMDIAKATSKFVFSSVCDCTYGKGVNIFSGSVWGTDSYFDRLCYEIGYKKKIISLYPLTESQSSLLKKQILDLRTSLAAYILNRIVNKALTLSKIRLLLSWDVQTLLQFPYLIMRVMVKKYFIKP